MYAVPASAAHRAIYRLALIRAAEPDFRWVVFGELAQAVNQVDQSRRTAGGGWATAREQHICAEGQLCHGLRDMVAASLWLWEPFAYERGREFHASARRGSLTSER